MRKPDKNRFRTLNVGCGFIKGVHKREGDIGLDVRRGICDIIADAQHLPFRERTFEEVWLYAVLEHLKNPIRCLEECIQVIKEKGLFRIVIPIEARGYYMDLKRIVTGFPFSIVELYRKYWRRLKYKPIPHSSRIRPEHIATLLEIKDIRVTGNHPWFWGRKGRILRRISTSLPESFGGLDWYIEAKKR